ncbi:YggS family pyridoxal phosphate-dependent enzyme [Pseudofrancisella aestuarii]|uniref:Pyridoxal phosphate homeostasis protein n=1 Tax=Pseudofrancisella aestuarii TaxID=2670347 RepID=A0ABV9TBY5_9GAMM|nr:YggS family pyridoxal phosphate-dependent enzyme [Pseudofrancisella aestuarii]
MFDSEFIKNAYTEIKNNIPKGVSLLAVSKYQTLEKIEYLHTLGQKDFGENYLQELEQKATALPNLNWHFIGSIQSRKIKNIVKYANTIQSIEKLEQLIKINSQASKLNKIIEVFLQINIDNDPNKSGFKPSDINEIIDCIERSNNMKNLNLTGLMCLPAKVDNSGQSFHRMKDLFDTINNRLNIKLTKLSMGMSGDYKEAIKNGSTMVRIGSSLFGERSK